MEVYYEITHVAGKGMGFKARIAKAHKSNRNHAGATINGTSWKGRVIQNLRLFWAKRYS